ncbi:uncharacterized protein LOC120771495 [Bactrocera tryoni]|uniref:uncharacterized protein LOC120771495 n=1 Tax=Bactrocera tryoni TaxID=59916 RepID=UPI001A971E85|nr:uncharacterized protein LOC120771495 [Bactrocera tryoni]
MTAVSIKYLAALLLVVGVICIKADGTENAETDAEIFASRDGLLNFIRNEALTLKAYIFKRIEELCKKINDEDLNTLIYKNKTSEAPDESEAADTRETLQRKCIGRLLSPFDFDDREELLLLKYGLDDIRKDMDRKNKEFFEGILRRIGKYPKGLAPEQQSKPTA